MIRNTLSSIGAHVLPQIFHQPKSPLLFRQAMGRPISRFCACQGTKVRYQVLAPKLMFGIVASSKRPQEAGVCKRWEGVMATVEIRDVRKAFGPVEILHGGQRRHRRRRIRRSCRAVRLRQVHPAAHAGGAWRTSRAARSRSAAGAGVVNAVPLDDRDIAMVFQNYALYPHMTVFDNMAFSLTLAKGAEGGDGAGGRAGREDPGSRAAAASLSPSASGGQRKGSPWAAPSSAIRRSSCSTSRFPTSTPSCACRCAARSRNCTSG